MKSLHITFLLLLVSPSFAQSDAAKETALHSVEVTGSKVQSYCVHEGGELDYVIFSKHAYALDQGDNPGEGRLHFEKAKLAKEHSIGFSQSERALVFSLPGNLVFHYALARSRVFVIEFDHHGFSPIVRQIPINIALITSPRILKEESARVYKWLDGASEAEKWEYTRELVPEREYKSGKHWEPGDRSIIWGEPHEVGLRLGIGGLEQNTRIPAGKAIPVKQYIMNAGTETLRLSPTGFLNEGLEANLIHRSGTKIAMKRGYIWPMFAIRIKLEPGHFTELQSSPLSTILENDDGTPSTPLRRFASGFVVPPGDYTLRLLHHIGKFIGVPVNASMGDPRLAPGLGEWTGTLQAAPISLQITEPAIGTGQPGSAVEIQRNHRIQFKLGQLVLSHRASGHTGDHTWKVGPDGNWPTPGDIWKTRDPSGNYNAAWDEGGTRLWYIDSAGIQKLNITGRKFEDAGFWRLDDATGDLAGMPDGVREALDLPAKERATP